MDGIGTRDRQQVIVIGATNQPNALDLALRRPGRFDREIVIDPPSAPERLAILQDLMAPYLAAKGANINLEAISKAAIGYVAADLAALHREAFIVALQTQLASQLEADFMVTTEHFLEAMKRVGPSLNRDYRLSLDTSITLDSIGGYRSIKEVHSWVYRCR